MANTDLPLDELRVYRPRVKVPSDFDDFWRVSMAQADGDIEVSLSPERNCFVMVDTFGMTFRGYNGDPIHAWLRVPKCVDAPHPTVIEFVGYNGGRGLSSEPSAWVQAGFAHITMDNRGQGSGTSLAATPDPVPGALGPSETTFVTRGISSRDTYYYRRLFVDAAKCVAAARSLGYVDPDRIFVEGSSQGGAMCLAAAAISQGVAGVMADVPFLCNIERAISITDAGPFADIARYMATRRGREAEVLEILSAFDGVNFAARGTAPALFSVALMDQIVPPSTVYAAYNAYAGQKEIIVYPFNGHEGGQAVQQARKLAWAVERLNLGGRFESKEHRTDVVGSSQMS